MLDSPLPTGTVTFLFTDIEGSTRLLQQLGDRYAALLARQQFLLRAACQAHAGRVVGDQGDSFFVAFRRAADALQAVVQSQHALANEDWPGGVHVRVRMGLHTGEAQVSATDYVGLDVHRAARIAAAAHGGQVLLSQSTYSLVEHDLPAGVTVRDLGEHRLKDLRRPKHLYQLVIAGLPADFPPLKSLDAARNNLPLQLTSFIGRGREIAEIRHLLAGGRLVTLTGPGGSGKTRLALQVAAGLVEDFSGGVLFIALAPISDPKLVASTIAHALGLTEPAGRSIVASLKDFLRHKSLLLVLDNFEQVMAEAPLVGELLLASSALKILVTSREGLRLSGECLYPVPPLPLPDLSQLPRPEALIENAAVELFVRRAQVVMPGFQVTPETAPAVAEICHRLEGLPLAIELAAARVRLMPPRAMLARLSDRLEFLTGGGRDLPPRQQTLRNAMAWSYDLLGETEQKLFLRLSVFVGGCTLAAIEAVAGDQPPTSTILDELGSLLDKSLLRQTDGVDDEPRFVMLEMLREFGQEKLAAGGEQDGLRRRHAEHYLALAQRAAASLEGAEQIQWMDRMEQEHGNLRAALEWSKTASGSETACWQLAGALGFFWEVRGYFTEGRAQLSDLLSMPGAQGHTAARALLLARAAELAYRQSDYPATQALAGESLAICRAIGDRPGIASALIKLANAATESGDYQTSAGYLEEALAIWRELSNTHGVARALISLGHAALRAGDDRRASARLEEALALSRELGDARSMGFELSGLGEAALRQQDYPRAARLVEESLALRRQLGNKWGVGVSLGTLGWVAMRQGDFPRAAARLRESLEVRREIGDVGGSAWCLERLADVAQAQQQPDKAVRLLGAAGALRASIGSAIDPADQYDYDIRQVSLRAALGAQRFAAAWDEGQAMPLEQAVAQALDGENP